ncbi:MAG TPA: flagellar motor protein MotB [Anaerolineae bacterium]|nr:flagellar motor protein MotB [Anaerolineae bacterium]HMR65410.1 flagellar motor protein MotB [Anaerolineae bacterium]
MARKKQEESEGVKQEWMASYGDMITLLMIFFVVLYSMANIDLKNFQKIAASMRVAFNNPHEAPLSSAVVGGDNSVTSSSQMAAAPLFTDSLPPKRRDFVRVTTELTTFAQQLDVGGEISVNMTMEGIIISLSEKLTFKPGSTELTSEAKKLLNEVADILAEIENKVRVDGHTDNLATNDPRYPTNWELSALRATSIVRYLSEEGGVEPARLSATGNAEFKPMMPNDTRANRSLNRRADIVIIYPGESRQFSLPMPSS